MAAAKKSARVSMAEAIKARRVSMRLTQAEAAAAGGLSLKSWTRVETDGHEDIAELTAAAIDRALGWPNGTTKDLKAGGAVPPEVDSRTLLDVSDLDPKQLELLQQFLHVLRR